MTIVYEIGPFRLDPDAGVLANAGVAVPMAPRAVAVLSVLIRHSNQYVSKACIIDTACAGVVVEESNLAVQISAIRRLLARAPGGERWIETLARRGYRFVGPVIELCDGLPRSCGAGGSAARSNLPEPRTSFVGRERELVELKRLLPRSRLLTLVGTGGIGKTRLALQIASEVTDAYRDGVWLVELGSTADPLLVPTVFAQVLGVQERPGTPLTDTVCHYLMARQMLLIVDNCEHLLDASAALVDAILRRAAQPTIIATSREALQVTGEQTYPLSALSLPDASSDVEAIARAEAVQLFVDRAQRQQPDFALTPERSMAIGQLCVHLDGIPLALELAAARIRALSIEQINARLDDRFRLLIDGVRTALPRQQTLRATLDWSFDLLAVHDRAVLRRLAIFSGGFTLEAATAIVSDPLIEERAVVDVLSQLVARSLVIADTNRAGARYRLLETTRAYAMEKLADADETVALKRRHAQYFCALFEPAYDDWLRLPDARWHAIYAPELDNVRAALDWALGDGDEPALAITLAGASGGAWLELSLRAEGLQRLEAALARIGPSTPESDHATIWLRLGALRGPAAPDQAVVALERAIDLFRQSGDAQSLAHAYLRLGRMYVFLGQFDQAAHAFAEALPEIQRTAVPKALAHYFQGMGFLKLLTGDAPSSRVHYEKALSLYRSAGAGASMLAMLINLADMTWAVGDLDAALARFREAVDVMRRSPLTRKDNIGTCLTNLAGLHTERGELDAALTAAKEGLPLRNEVGHAWGTLDHLALRAALAGKLANAARVAGFADAAFATRKTARPPNEARAHDRLEAMLKKRLRPGERRRLLAEGAALSEDDACRIALED